MKVIIWFPGRELYRKDMAGNSYPWGKAVILAVQEEISKIKNCD